MITKSQRIHMVKTAKARIAREAQRYRSIVDIKDTDKISIAKGIWGL